MAFCLKWLIFLIGNKGGTAGYYACPFFGQAFFYFKEDIL